ncbi:MAG: Fe-S cluster assembly protein SufD [Lutibacter sp.]|jgi:Fe-S cluster assembly protein SufD|nr:Fe-S cluster assembly protein SufD [Lutibacter sp.]
MDLTEKLASSFLAFENSAGIDLDAKVHEIRTRAIQSFEQQGFPSKKDEAWKYTSLKALLQTDFSLFPAPGKPVGFKQVKEYLINEIDSYNLIFIDGVFSAFLSSTTHEGYDICVLSSALSKPKYNLVIDRYFNTIPKERNSLSELNTAFTREGAFVNIPRNTIVPKPIQILNFSTGSEHNVLLQPRNLIVVGENAHVQIIERHQNLSENTTLTNAVTEIFAHKRAVVDYYKIQRDTLHASLIDSTYVSQKKESVVSVNTFSFGGKLTRNNLEFYHDGENISSHLNGLSVLGNTQHVDNHTLVNHRHPNCESHELYKGIYADRSIGVFNGKVMVAKEAQKTNAFQQNNSVLIDDGASVNAKPQLEIFADDVKCSHGCTIGQLDKDALFYLQSRGIPEKEARALLLYAFGNDVVNKIKIPQLKARITQLIASKLGVELGFDL